MKNIEVFSIIGKVNFSSIVQQVSINWLYHVQIHFLPWSLNGISRLLLFFIVFIPTLARSTALFRLRMIRPHFNNKRIFIFYILFWIIEDTVCMLFSLDLLLYLWVELLPFGLLQIHPQIVEPFRCRCYVCHSQLFLLFLKEIVRPPVLKQVRWQFSLVFAGRGFDGEVTSLLCFYELDVFVLNAYYCRLLVFAKEIVLLLVLNPPEGLDGAVIKIDGAQVCIALVASLQVPLQKQVVSRRNVVVLVGLYAPLSILYVKLEFVEFLQDGVIYGYSMEPYYYPAV